MGNKATLQPGKVKGLGRHCGLLASSSLLASLLFDMGKIPDGGFSVMRFFYIRLTNRGVAVYQDSDHP